MKFWFDTEFVERPCTIDLISIGIVAEDGRTFYAESSEVDWTQASLWVLDNVRPLLKGGEFLMTRQEIGYRVRQFVGDEAPEFWGYFADYDWVVFCWLFGTMMALPDGWPMFCRDIIQWCHDLGGPRLPPHFGAAHNALDDALWTKDCWEFLQDYSGQVIRKPLNRGQAQGMILRANRWLTDNP